MKTKEKNDLRGFSSHNVECDRFVYTNDTEQFTVCSKGVR